MRRLDNRKTGTARKLQHHGALHTGVPLLQLASFARVHGYARVSREDQNMDMQATALKQAGVQDFFVEKISAVRAHRPQFNLMMKLLESGDTLVVYAFNRLCRNLKQLLTLVDDLKALGVKLKSTSEPHIDPYTTNGRFTLSIVGASDENELGRLKDRTRDGMAARKAQGMFFGRQRIITPAIAKKMQKLRDAGVPPKAIPARLRLKIKVSTVYANTAAKDRRSANENLSNCNRRIDGRRVRGDGLGGRASQKSRVPRRNRLGVPHGDLSPRRSSTL